MSDAPEPVTDEAIADLRRRLRATRFVDAPGDGWARGTDPVFLRDLLRYWADGYDWRAAETRIRALPWERAADLRVVHRRGPVGGAVVVLLHGWPDSVLRFERVLPLLDDVTVVVPALPGFPFSDSAGRAGAAMAEPLAAALTALGHDQVVLSAGDVGTPVAQAFARRYPERTGALHVTDVTGRPLATVPPEEWTEADRRFQDAATEWLRTEGAYAVEQSTKPATLAVALGDSPAGLAAWIVEKLRSWSDCDGDVETVFPREDLLTWISAYWFTGAIGTSFAPYSESRPPVTGRPIAPTVVSPFPKDLLGPARSTAEHVFDVRVWSPQASGGHFAAWERPDAFVAALRQAVALAGH